MNMKQFLQELEQFSPKFSVEALDFYHNLQENTEKTSFTEKGLKILQAMQDNQEKYSNIFSSKQLGEILFMPPRSVSGSIKKLLNEGYVEKKGSNPVTYGLTIQGINYSIDKK